MVPEGKHVKSVVSELVGHYKSTGNYDPSIKTTFLDSSTIDIPTSRDVHQLVKSSIPEFDFIDTQCLVVLQEQEREHCHLCCPEKPMMILIQV